MALYCLRLSKDPKANEYISSLKNKSLEPNNLLTNPIRSKVYWLKKGEYNYLVHDIELTTFPFYWAVPVLWFSFWVFPSVWVAIPLGAAVGFSFVYTASFWYLISIFALRRKGYKGKCKRISPAKMWRLFLGAN